MTLTVTREVSNLNLVVDDSQRRVAAKLDAQLQGHAARLAISEQTSGPRPLDPALASILAQVVKAMASGATVSIRSIPEEITTTVAAEQLGISRPTLMKMIAAREIPAHKVGTHHRLKSSDVAEFRRQRLKKQRQALEDLNELLGEDD